MLDLLNAFYANGGNVWACLGIGSGISLATVAAAPRRSICPAMRSLAYGWFGIACLFSAVGVFDGGAAGQILRAAAAESDIFAATYSLAADDSSGDRWILDTGLTADDCRAELQRPPVAPPAGARLRCLPE